MSARRVRAGVRGAVVGAAIVASAFRLSAGLAGAATPAGTVIQNTATATYQDGSSTSYSANSNTVQTTVQNAPALTESTSNQNIAPNQQVTDSFTLTNTGNSSGDFQVSSQTTTGGTSQYYTVNGGATQYANLTALNAALAGMSVASGSSLTIQVVYNNTTSAGSNVTDDLQATISYAANGAATAQTSAAGDATATDPVVADARLDLKLTSAQDPSSGAITYTVTANDGGAMAAHGAQATQGLGFTAGNGFTPNGILIADKLPIAGTPSVSLTITGTPTCALAAAGTNGVPASGTTAQVVYTATADGSSGWTTTKPGSPVWIGCYLSSTATPTSTAGVLNSNPTGSSGAGAVTAPAVTLTFVVNQPTGSGAGNAGSVQEIADAVITNNNATPQLVGPGISGTADGTGATSTLVGNATSGINNLTAQQSPSGASQKTSDQALTALSVYNGPYQNPQATGSFDGSATDNTHDFTAVSFGQTADNPVTTNTTPSWTPTSTSTTATGLTAKVPSTVQNAGNKDDTYTIVATAPTGFTVQLFQDSSGSPSATPLGGATAGATSTASNVAIGSGASLHYWAVYTVTSPRTYYQHYTGTVVATSVTDNTKTNTTNHLLYAGLVALTVTQSMTNTHCPTGETPGPAANTVCPGDTITYVVDYRNIVYGQTSSAPTASFKYASTTPGSLVISEDGTGGMNWSVSTNGLNAAPSDTTSSTAYTYFSGASGTTNTGGVAAGATKFTAQVGGASFQLVPSGSGIYGGTSQGTITFAVTVK